LFTAEAAQAQIGIGIGVGGYRGGGGGFYYGNYGRYGPGGYYGRYHDPGFYYGYGRGYYDPGYSRSSYYYAQPRGYVQPAYAQPAYVQPAEYRQAVAGPQPVYLNVQVPADAEVWIDGAKTTQMGANRRFASPPLTPGKNYTYEVTATWMKMASRSPRSAASASRPGSRAS
jgi:uncharacterized protein (TIGR03000 family)